MHVEECYGVRKGELGQNAWKLVYMRVCQGVSMSARCHAKEGVTMYAKHE